MAATSHSSSLVSVHPVFTDAERLALAGYRGLTREACTLDLRQFTGWCRTRSLPLFSARRADIETFARELEARGRVRATVSAPALVLSRSAAPRLVRRLADCCTQTSRSAKCTRSKSPRVSQVRPQTANDQHG
jgi:hypothetical protein